MLGGASSERHMPREGGCTVVVRQVHLIALVVAFLIGCAVLLLMVGCAGTSSEAPQEEKQGHTEATKKEQAHSPEATASEQDRCEGTRTYHLYNVSYNGGGEGPLRTGSEEDMKKAQKKASHDYKWGVKTQDFGVYTTNDLPGCPKGGLLKGTDKADKLGGKDGDDEIRGLGGPDYIYGGPGSDMIYGGPGDDKGVFGQEGDDVIYGGPGDDWMLDGGEGEDVIYGGDGNDILGARDGQRDKLYCGEGKDRYLADKIDY